jgi:hypothetical protein
MSLGPGTTSARMSPITGLRVLHRMERLNAVDGTGGSCGRYSRVLHVLRRLNSRPIEGTRTGLGHRHLHRLPRGNDLGAVWDAPTTTDKDRKQLLRTLLEEVNTTLHRDDPGPHAELVLRRTGGAISELTVPLRRRQPTIRGPAGRQTGSSGREEAGMPRAADPVARESATAVAAAIARVYPGSPGDQVRLARQLELAARAEARARIPSRSKIGSAS